MANVETSHDETRSENTFLGSGCNIRTQSSMSGAGGSTTSLFRIEIWALGKILGEEPLFSCMDLSFDERKVLGKVTAVRLRAARGA